MSKTKRRGMRRFAWGEGGNMKSEIISGIKCILYLFGLMALALPAQAASFDCGKAATKVEKFICGDAEISKLDEELNTAYKAALKDGTTVDSIKQAQKQWVKERNGCSDAACVKSAYEERLHELLSEQTGNHRRENDSDKHHVRTESYLLVMSKNDEMCKHMLQEFNDDMRQYGQAGYNFHERHEEFTSIPWGRARASYEADGQIQYTEIEGALFDFNNDGVQDFVVRDQSMLSGMRADEIFMLDAEVAKRANELTYKELGGSKNDIRIAGSLGYPLSTPLEGQTSDGWVLIPFRYRSTYYLFMRSVAVNLMSNISVVAKYESGKFVDRDMTGKMEDICYYKYVGAKREN